MSTTDNIKRAEKLSRRLSKVDQALDGIVNIMATTDNTSNIFWLKIKTDIKKEYEVARKISKTWTESNIPAVYKNELNKQLSKIKKKKIPGIRKVPASQFANTNIAKQSVSSLIDQTTATFISRFTAGENTLIDLSRLTQQVLLDEKLVNKNIADGFISKGNVRESKKRLQKALMKQSLDGKFVTIIDRNGKPTKWRIDKYAEMVARTKLQETSTQAVVNSAMAVGGDLVQVSSHNTKTPFDAQFEGKIFSLTGNDKDFPRAGALPPFHPNCMHSITVTFKEGLEAAGILNKSIDFANGKTDIHPTRKSHIPVTKREFPKVA